MGTVFEGYLNTHIGVYSKLKLILLIVKSNASHVYVTQVLSAHTTVSTPVRHAFNTLINTSALHDEVGVIPSSRADKQPSMMTHEDNNTPLLQQSTTAFS
jgi:hypothetical protein